ncbi:hypothetical protein DY000_02050909 [Brassica cretica]|uniref:SHSP domain-containing protein n=1 Tax=Brassica cretica TaxID=69181 RepID=A0ABQ7F5M7_BRACR|nr:hypothetical protein DY000_02050909 [Brassica cretica]
MQPDIWEEWWRPACVLDMQPAMWSTRCRRACVWSHAKRHTGCHQPEADWLLSSINRHDFPLVSKHADLSKPMPREGCVQLKVNQVKISSDGKQVNVAREGERNKVVDLEYSRSSPRRPIHGFRSVEVLLDTPLVSPKNCLEAKGGSVRVQISLSRPVSFFMVKPRLCPRLDQSSPLQSSRQLGFGQVFSDQPAASRLEHLQVPVIFKDSVVAGGRTIWGIFGHIGRSPSCDVGTTGAKPAHARHVLGWTSISSVSYSAGSRKPLIRWIGKTHIDGVMAYG